MVGPVLVVELHKLHWIGLDVDPEVAQVRDGVCHGLEEDDGASHLVNVDVVIQRENRSQAESSHEGDGVPQDQDKDEDGVEDESPAASPRDEVEDVGDLLLVIFSSDEH